MHVQDRVVAGVDPVLIVCALTECCMRHEGIHQTGCREALLHFQHLQCIQLQA